MYGLGSHALASNARAVRAGVIDPRQERLILEKPSCCSELGGKRRPKEDDWRHRLGGTGIGPQRALPCLSPKEPTFFANAERRYVTVWQAA